MRFFSTVSESYELKIMQSVAPVAAPAAKFPAAHRL